jgi:hypothetical protein
VQNHALHRASSLSHDARYLGSIKVEYVLHPLYGRRLTVVRQETRNAMPELLVQTDHAHLVLPQWMTDPQCCAKLSCGPIPLCSWQALQHLQALLVSLDATAPTAAQNF